MAVLVMGIGVVSLASLFPISILRTARANQYTNATILFHNAQGLILTYPHLVHDPDNDAEYYRLPITDPQFGAGAAEHYNEDADGDGQLDPGEDQNGNMQLDRGVYLVDPLGWHTYTELGNGLEGTFGNDGANPPAADTTRGVPRFSGSGTYSLPQPQTNSFDYGYLWMDGTANLTPPGIPFVTGTTATDRRRAAARWFLLPDSWQDVVTAPITGVQTGQSGVIGVDLDVSADQLLDVVPASARYRLTLFESSGTVQRPGSVAREVTRVTGNSLFWSEDLDSDGTLDPGEDFNGNGVLDTLALPSGFQVQRARLEVQDWRFSWLLTVRKGTLPPSFTEDPPMEVDMVVFFRRSFREEDETIFAAHFERSTSANQLPGWDNEPGEAGTDDDGDGQTDGGDPEEYGALGTDDLRTAYLFWNSTGGLEPDLEKGAFVFETETGQWNRIQDFRIESSTTNTPPHPPAPGGEDTRATLLLERELVDDSARGAIVMPGVIEVFRLGQGSLPPLDSPTRVR